MPKCNLNKQDDIVIVQKANNEEEIVIKKKKCTSCAGGPTKKYGNLKGDGRHNTGDGFVAPIIKQVNNGPPNKYNLQPMGMPTPLNLSKSSVAPDRFNLQPMGQELDRQSLINPKAIDENGKTYSVYGVEGEHILGDEDAVGGGVGVGGGVRGETEVPPGRIDVRNLEGRNWWEFHKSSGKRVLAPGTMPTWGLWRPINDVPVRACGRTSIPIPYVACSEPLLTNAKLYYG